MKERFNPGTDLTANANEAVTGKTFLRYAGAMKNGLISVAPAKPGEAVAGVCKYNAKADDLVGVARGSGRIVTVTATAALTAGSAVSVGANGKAAPAGEGITVGWAVDDAGEGDDALISLAH
ncbi:DUF2190 family protein [Corynebacterium macginleyi]|nr:DUF2190 family protein [Corynebacterium macginleyi]